MAVYKTKKEMVYYKLREEIIRGMVPPDSKVTISGLATKFKVSEIPVREAVQQLVQEGYLCSSPHKGIIISAISEKDVHEIFQIRIALESLAARLAVKNMSNIDIQQLNDVLGRSELIRDQADYRAYWDINHEFHNTLSSFCNNARLVDMIASLMFHSNRFPQQFYTTVEQIDDSIYEHRKIVEMLFERDEQAVEDLIRMHTVDGYKKVLKKLQEAELADSEK